MISSHTDLIAESWKTADSLVMLQSLQLSSIFCSVPWGCWCHFDSRGLKLTIETARHVDYSAAKVLWRVQLPVEAMATELATYCSVSQLNEATHLTDGVKNADSSLFWSLLEIGKANWWYCSYCCRFSLSANLHRVWLLFAWNVLK